MNEEIKIRWIDALLSGEFTQGKGYLNRNGTFCCLGVLCELARREGIVEAKPDAERSHVIGYNECTSYPPDEVIRWANLSETNPLLKFFHSDTSLSYLNDDNMSFTEIAKLIQDQI